MGKYFFATKTKEKIWSLFRYLSGYYLRTENEVNKTLKSFDDAVGFEHLKIVHLNDSKGELGCRVDRHYHIGLGHIGEKGLSKVVKIMNKKNIPLILETPIDDKRDDFGNIKKAKQLA